jgi:hypothetical protein
MENILTVGTIRVLSTHEQDIIERALTVMVTAPLRVVSSSERQFAQSMLEQRMYNRFFWAAPVQP